jgi:hypothetical protein
MVIDCLQDAYDVYTNDEDVSRFLLVGIDCIYDEGSYQANSNVCPRISCYHHIIQANGSREFWSIGQINVWMAENGLPSLVHR